MGDRLDVVSPAMKTYGQQAQAAGGRISKLDVAGAASQVAAALPGGTAGRAAAECALNHDIPGWGKAIAAQGRKVGSADDTYSAAELSNSGRFECLQVAGSPGVGTQDVRGLHLDPHHVHSTIAKNDIINLGESHGMEPTAPGFGGQTFHSDPGTSGPWYQGGYGTEAHGEYWDKNNPALDHMAHIIAGK